MNNYVTGCHDCDRLTSGRCWRHSITVNPTGVTYVIPPFVFTPVDVVPLTPFEYPATVPK